MQTEQGGIRQRRRTQGRISIKQCRARAILSVLASEVDRRNDQILQ